MSGPEELPDDVAQLLTAEQYAPGPPAGAKERVLERIDTTLGGGGGGGGGGGQAAGSSPALPIVPPAAAGPAALVAAAVSLVVGVGVSLTVTGNAHTARTEHRAPVEVVAPVEPPVEPPGEPSGEPPVEEPPKVAPVAEEPPAPAAPRARRARAASPPAAPAPPPVDTLAAEQALLERARKNLARDYPTQAKATLLEHRARFASGQLAEEREALLVLALVKAGEREAAMDQAARFRARWPSSLHAGIVDAALSE